MTWDEVLMEIRMTEASCKATLDAVRGGHVRHPKYDIEAVGRRMQAMRLIGDRLEKSLQQSEQSG